MIWEHPDSCAESVDAHMCPNPECGDLVSIQYHGDEPAQLGNLYPDCFRESSPIDLLIRMMFY